jgi:hypothetical protein
MNFKIIMMMMIIIINSFCNHCSCSILQDDWGYRHQRNINLIFLMVALEKLKDLKRGWGGEGGVIRPESGLPCLHHHSDHCGYLVAAYHFAEKHLVCHQAGSLGLYPPA